jgi:hypothetical protein
MTVLERAFKNPDIASKLGEELRAMLFKTSYAGHGGVVSGQELIDAVYSLAGFHE